MMHHSPEGQIIKGYKLVQKIGSGSFGEVYLAHQAQVKRDVAIKIILPNYANNPDFIRRFEAEAQLVARLEHPFIVPLYDYWREPGGAYLVMRYLRGGSLRDLLEQDEPLPLAEAARLTDQIAAALQAAHQGGVVHRDLKPGNILLDEQGNAYLADFGIAKDIEQPADATLHGAVVGSPAYLSPEQVRSDEINALSDIYSLGIMLYEMLTAEKPFYTESISALLLKQLHDPLPDVRDKRPELPENVNRVIQRATAKNAEERYPNALVVAAAFRKALGLELPEVGTGAMSISLTRSAESTQERTPGSSLAVALPDPDNPYKGLRAFQESDAVDFFGRESLTDLLLERLREDHPLARFLALVGPSGSGKSSVVKAGVLPALRGGALPSSAKWFVVEMVPGAHPFEELEASLLRIAINPPESLLHQLREDENGLLRAIKRILPSDPTAELFLFIDQFEEIFTQVQDEATRALFLHSLINAVQDPHSRLRLVITMRADFYDKPLSYNKFGTVIRQRTEVILPLSHAELEAAIAKPAERVGLRLESGLVPTIIADVETQPGALPLLQYALMELYERREKGTLTIAAYQDIGGVSGALARRAEELFLKLSADEQAIAQQMFLRLVALGEGTEDTRRRVLQSEILSMSRYAETLETIIALYGKYRLLTFDHDPQTREPTLEVAHEALIRQWSRLRHWIDDMRSDLRQRARLVARARDWEAAHQDPSYLATGTQLAQMREWALRTELVLTDRESAYLNTSIDQHEQALAAERARQARERAQEIRNTRLLRALALVMTAAALVAVVLTIFAFQERNQAENNQRVAQSLALVANARNALNDHLPGLGLRLALEASTAHDPTLPDAERMLASTVYGPGIRYLLPGEGGSSIAVALSPDGVYLAGGAMDGSITLWNLQTGALERHLQGHESAITDLTFSRRGDLLLSGSLDATMRLWDVSSGAELMRYADHIERVNAVAFSPDEQFVASGSGNFNSEDPDATVRLWNRHTGEVVRQYVHLGAVHDLDFTPDGRFMATASGQSSSDQRNQDRRARLWNVETGQLVDRFEGFSGLARALDISPDGSRLAVGTWDSIDSGTIRIFDLNSGAELRRIYAHSNIITRVAFLPDGARVASASWDNTVRIWDVNTGLEVQQFAEQGDRVLGLAVSTDGEYLAAASGNIGDNYEDDRAQDSAIRYWDLRTRAEITRYNGHTDWVWAVAYSPDGALVASGSGYFLGTEGDNTIRLWNTETGAQRAILQGHTDTVDHLRFSDDGRFLFSASWDGTAKMWNVSNRTIVRTFGGHLDRVLTLDLSPDGTRLYTASLDKTIIEWEVATGNILQILEGDGGGFYTIQAHPDGEHLISGDTDGEIAVWNLGTGAKERTLDGHANRVERVHLNPDSTRLVSTSRDGTVRLWNFLNGEELLQFIGHTGGVPDVVFDPSGDFVLTGGSDRSVRVWNASTGEELRRFEGHTDWVVSVDFSPDGLSVLSGSDDLTVRRWQFARTVADMQAWARENRFVPLLSCEQRRALQLGGC